MVGGLTVSSHKLSATISLVFPKVQRIVRVLEAPPHSDGQGLQGPGDQTYPSPPEGVALIDSEGMLYSNSTPGFVSWYNI